MARPKKDSRLRLSEPIELTAGAIDRLDCPAGKDQAFLRDTKAPGLRVRVTAAGAKSFVFEAKLNRKTIRRTIGDVRAWSIVGARAEANRLRVTLDSGDDPREIERHREAQRIVKQKADETAETAASMTMQEAWDAYLTERRDRWGERHYQDHLAMAKAGGKPAKRGTNGKGVTVPGPIHPLLAHRLSDVTPEVIEAWAAREGKTRPTYGRLGWRCLKAFLNWCTEQSVYKNVLPLNPAKTKRARESFGKPTTKSDVLQREQLIVWFGAVRNLPNSVIAAYLQTLLLTGARRGEVLALRWEDVNTKWKGLTIRDKVEGERVIPLTPYVAELLQGLPRRNDWVFSSGRGIASDEKNAKRRAAYHARRGSEPPAGTVGLTSASGRVVDPSIAHKTACTAAGVEDLTLHGLRRSFKSLTEWLEIPAGVVAQIMGHKPSATAEKHYTVRPLDLLRMHHEKIEAWILKQAGVSFVANSEPGKLRVVA